jgi:hypothetical protein
MLNLLNVFKIYNNIVLRSRNRDYVYRGFAALTTRYPSIRIKLAVTSPTRGGRSVGIIRSRTQATEFSF